MLKVESFYDEDTQMLTLIIDDFVIAKIKKDFYKKKIDIPKNVNSIEEAKEWFSSLEKKRAKSYALYLLSKRSYHSSVFKNKLQQKLISKKTIEWVLKELKFYFDDESWVDRKVEKEIKKGFGPKMIRAKLQQKRIFLEDMKISDDRQKETIKELLEKKFPKNFDKRKAISFLLRRGFDYPCISEEIVSKTAKMQE
jgi:SOS response regulatory protein OraA/RecX